MVVQVDRLPDVDAEELMELAAQLRRLINSNVMRGGQKGSSRSTHHTSHFLEGGKMPTRHVEAEIILRWVRDAAGFEVTLLYDNPDDNHDYQEFVSTTLRLDTVDPVGYPPAFKGESGWWDFTHESRLDLAQLCGSVFLLLVGAGHYFLDTLNRTTVANSAPR